MKAKTESFTSKFQSNKAIKIKEIGNLITYKNKIKEKHIYNSNTNKKYSASNLKIFNQRLKRNKIELKYLIIITFIILLNLFTNIMANQEMKSYESKIILKIKHIGTAKIYNPDFKYPPDKVLISEKKHNVNYEYYFDSRENIIELIWDEINFESCEKMFFECSDISEIVFLNFFNELKIKDINNMFNGCSSLKSLNLGEFSLSKINNMSNTFRNCVSLTSLNLSNILISENGSMDYMFYNCSNLKYINMEQLIDVNYTSLNDNYSHISYFNIFYNIPENIIICINPENKIILNELSKTVECFFMDCSDFWIQNKILTKNNITSCINNCFNISENCHNDCAKKYLNDICYKNCSYFYYFDYDNNYICTENDSCPKKYNTLIFEKKECIDNSLEVLYTIIDNIVNNFTFGSYNTSYLYQGIDDIIFHNDASSLTITKIEYQKNNENNYTSTIDLGDCKQNIRKYYNLSDNETIYILKKDTLNEGMKIPEISFEIYARLNGTNPQKLNLSICLNTKMEIKYQLPINLSESEESYLRSFSNKTIEDNCLPAQSSSGADLTSSDRKKEYIERSIDLCQKNCFISGYDIETKYVKCDCLTLENNLDIYFLKESCNKDEKNDKTNLYDEALALYNKYKEDITNLHKFNIIYSVLSCSKNIKLINLNNNIGFYVIGIIIIFNIILCFLFFKRDFNELNQKISDIIFAKKNINLLNDKVNTNNNKKQNNRKCNNNMNNNITQKDNSIKDNFISKKRTKNKSKTSKKFIKYKNNDSNVLNLNNNKANQIIISLNDNNNKIRKKIKSKTKKYNKINNTTTTVDLNEKEKLIKKISNIMKLTEDELHDLDYDGAIKYDKRTYFQISWSLMKTKNPIIFTFFYNNDYNSKFLKICVFLLAFTICYNLCVFFYDQDKLYEIKLNNNKYIYDPNDTIYSSLISAAINKIFKFLAFSNDNILKIKNSKFKKKNLDEKEKKLKKILNIKFILFFILSFIYLIFCWYSLTSFGIIYSNTQKYSMYDGIISFTINVLPSFLVYFIPGFFRKLALSNPKKKKICLYKFSKIVLFILTLIC